MGTMISVPWLLMYCRRFSLPWARSIGLQRQTTLSARYWSSSSSKEQRYKYRYEPSAVESKWQAEWKRRANSSTKEVDNSLRLAEAPAATNKGEGRGGGGGESSVNGGKYYMLSMFPYPSGRLHMGHVRVYTISDTLAHFHRMQGKNVLHPMGWDAFGLPAENAAIEKGTTPAKWTKDNISAMRNQLNRLGCQFDWNREVTTCSPDYYKWTQWLFLKLYEHRLAYKKQALVNWDPVDQTVLANEQVDSDGCSWRSGAKVEQKMLDQWFFKITHYAEALLEGLKELDWPEKVKTMQEHWIGKSEGAYFDFPIAQEEASGQTIRVFTTKADTLFGVSFLALSPEHDLLQSRRELFTETVLRAVDEMRNNQSINSSSDVDANNRPKNGIAVGLRATHPLTGARVPVYVADYIIGEYGTKAVMGVPAHDDRDLLFANEHGLPVVKVIEVPEAKKGGSERRGEREGEEENGVLVNSGQFSGMSVEQGRREITHYAEREGFGGHMTQYKLRDWLISRQRYWGAPIPVLYCDKCGEVPVCERDLPVLLPEDIEFTGRGPSPLARAEHWLQASCGKPDCCAVRETDTIDTFVDSSWYFLRYINPNNTESPFTTEDANLWMPVDTYVGGIEHAVLHLLYARFITHFLHDIGLVRHKEPFKKLLTQGMVQGKTHRLKESGRYLKPEEIESNQFSEDQVDVSWEKMSKSKYNGVEPEDIINKFGADTVRLFMLFRAPPSIDIQWDMTAIITFERWQKRLWDLVQIHRSVCEEEGVKPVAEVDSRKLRSAMHRTIKQVTEALEEQNTFNVAVAELMAFSNHIRDSAHLVGSCDYHMAVCTLCTLLAPMAPHIASEMWVELREAAIQLQISSPEDNVLEQPWPRWSEEEIREGASEIQVMICVNGKKKGTISVPVEWTSPDNHSQLETEAVYRARDEQLIGSHMTVTKVIVAAHGNLVNLVIRS